MMKEQFYLLILVKLFHKLQTLNENVHRLGNKFPSINLLDVCFELLLQKMKLHCYQLKSLVEIE